MQYDSACHFALKIFCCNIYLKTLEKDKTQTTNAKKECDYIDRHLHTKKFLEMKAKKVKEYDIFACTCNCFAKMTWFPLVQIS